MAYRTGQRIVSRRSGGHAFRAQSRQVRLAEREGNRKRGFVGHPLPVVATAGYPPGQAIGAERERDDCDGAAAARFNVYFASLLADFRRIVL